MILKKLLVSNFGPFSGAKEITFEKGVTIFTGANDTGKSSILRLLSYIGNKRPVSEDDVNIDRLLHKDASYTWRNDRTVYCIATYEMTSNYELYLQGIPKGLTPGFEIDVEILLAPDVYGYKIKSIRGLKNNTTSYINIKRFPKTLLLSSLNEIKSTIDFSNLSDIEQQFLTLAFGKNGAERLSVLSDINLDIALHKGEERLNSAVKKILPPSMQVEFILRKSSDKPLKISVMVKDKLGSLTAFHNRGAGVRKIINLLTNILFAQDNYIGETILLLLDEPENSLHSDAQHVLRYFLERLSDAEKIQVVYATHSPAMLNVYNPQSIRLFKRKRNVDVVTSIVDNKPIHDNFKPIRSSLGILPSDSLLYAPVTIIVEGITEQQAVPTLLLRLERENLPSFQGISRLLSLTWFLNGHGSSFEYWCSMAEEQGVYPIIFVDADKQKELIKRKFSEKHPNVPIIRVGKQEFEDIIHPEFYFKALSDEMENSELTYQNFKIWLDQSDNRVKRMAFTKQVGKWLEDLGIEKNYYKDKVALRAVQIVDLDKIDLTPFEALVKSIKTAISLI